LNALITCSLNTISLCIFFIIIENKIFLSWLFFQNQILCFTKFYQLIAQVTTVCAKRNNSKFAEIELSWVYQFVNHLHTDMYTLMMSNKDNLTILRPFFKRLFQNHKYGDMPFCPNHLQVTLNNFILFERKNKKKTVLMKNVWNSVKINNEIYFREAL
jgi:hypothetical protein